MFKCVLSKMKYFLSSFELRHQMILLIFSVRFQFNNFNYSITTSRFLRLNLSEMHMRTLWHQTIGRFYYPSIDVGLILRFTIWANSFSWSSYVVSAVSRRSYD